MRLASPLVLLALASCLASLPARADSPAPAPPDAAKPDAKHDAGKPAKPDPVKSAAARLAELIKRGAELCAGGDVDEGLPALHAAWAQHQDADLAVTVATCEIKATDWPAAAEHLAFALRNKDDPEQRKAIEPTFVNVRARVGAVKVKVTVDGADVFVGDRFAGQSPLPAEVYVSPGRGRIFAKKTGYGEIEGIVEVQANGTASVTLDLASEGAVAASHRTLTTRSRTPAYVLGAIGLIVVGAGGAIYASGASKGSAADSLLAELKSCNPSIAGCATLQSLRSSHDTLVNAGAGVLGTGGAVLGAAVIYGIWANLAPPPDRAGSAAVAPSAWVSPAGGGLSLRGTF